VVARAFRDQFGFEEFYLADLDAIRFGKPALGTYVRLQDEGFRLWIDAGVRTSRDDVLTALGGLETASIIVGLESVHGPMALEQIAQRIGMDRVVFSLDLKGGQILGRPDLWHSVDPWSIAERVIKEIGVQRLIVLDLAKVGTGEGTGTDDLCARLRKAFPDLQLTAGGGVRSIDDVNKLLTIGVDRVLVASALHDGKITPQELA
jgi:phosphoribosylformimino-5-aminoimidazole carboxamide ribotide isomerase